MGPSAGPIRGLGIFGSAARCPRRRSCRRPRRPRPIPCSACTRRRESPSSWQFRRSLRSSETPSRSSQSVDESRSFRSLEAVPNGVQHVESSESTSPVRCRMVRTCISRPYERAILMMSPGGAPRGKTPVSSTSASRTSNMRACSA